MWLEKISLLDFKNYAIAELTFSEQINCFVGENGSGKTNLLDAIYYLSTTKSAFSSTEAQNVRHGAPYFLIKGTYHKQDERFAVQFSWGSGPKKDARCNQVTYEKLSEHVGQFPCVLISPDDTDLIREGSETRRRFFDSIIAQIDAVYLDKLIRYNHVLKQRNSLLKQFADRQTYEADLLDSYSDQLLELGHALYQTRQVFVERFIPIFIRHYANLSGEKEPVTIAYESHFAAAEYREIFYRAYRKDLVLQRTTQGIHKDDFVFQTAGYPTKKYGSQGQQKSYVIALKLAQFEMIKQEKGFKPLLLLDDIFDKLDDFRIGKLTEMVVQHTFGQLFVTDARPERTQAIFQPIEADQKVFLVDRGEVVEEKVMSET